MFWLFLINVLWLFLIIVLWLFLIIVFWLFLIIAFWLFLIIVLWLFLIIAFWLFPAAGNAFCESAKIQLRLKSNHEAATNYVDAGNCYKKADPNGMYINCLQVYSYIRSQSHIQKLIESMQKDNEESNSWSFLLKILTYPPDCGLSLDFKGTVLNPCTAVG